MLNELSFFLLFLFYIFGDIHWKLSKVELSFVGFFISRCSEFIISSGACKYNEERDFFLLMLSSVVKFRTLFFF